MQTTLGLSAAGVNDTTASEDVPCPSVSLRTGASTLIIGSKPGPGEPAPLDVRYQASVVNMARECRLNAGLLTMKSASKAASSGSGGRARHRRGAAAHRGGAQA